MTGEHAPGCEICRDSRMVNEMKGTGKQMQIHSPVLLFYEVTLNNYVLERDDCRLYLLRRGVRLVVV